MRSIFYGQPQPTAAPSKCLVAGGGAEGQRFSFFDRVEIGRYHPGQSPAPAQLLVDDPTVSRRHCYVTQNPDGRCWIRDVSSNGTRLDGRRLVPNLEFEIRPGQIVGLGKDTEFELVGEAAGAVDAGLGGQEGTVGLPGNTVVTVLVGDIRDYTVLVRRAPPEQLQRSVSRVFDTLSEDVIRLGGTVKEYQGDALFAFWDQAENPARTVGACGAALELDRRAREIATDPSIWQLDGFPLEMDWALTTGMVVIDTFGGNHPTGLSMIGPPVVLAFRQEKFATDETGRILACEATQMVAREHFDFRDLGKMQAKGFDEPDRVFALLGREEEASGSGGGDEPAIGTLNDMREVDP